MKTAIIAGLVATLTASVDAYIRFNCATNIVEERADPLVDPLAISGHAHKIAGANAFDMNKKMTYKQLRSSKCSSCSIKQDLSIYWTAKLYYHGKNGSFTSVPMVGDTWSDLNGGMVVYYQQRGPNINNLTAFPEGFRMLAGDPFKRNFTGDFAAEAINFACLGSNQPETNYLPPYKCPGGLRAQVYFPSCWNGELDSKDHKSHMSYPASGSHDNGPCPKSHPIQTISLFYEVLYATYLFDDDWYGNKQPFVFSNGDPEGYGFHGDFINGWDVKALQQVTDQCNDLSVFGSTEKKDCPPIDQFTYDEQMQCKVPSQVKEPVRGLLSKLPGCNPVQHGPGYAKVAKCSYATTTTISSAQEVQDSTFTDETGKGWSYIGCALDNLSGQRTLDGSTTMYSAGVGDTMTVEYCLEFCKDYMYAGLEYSTQCFCGNSLPAAAAPKSGQLGSCGMMCAGNSTQFCGGSAVLSTYKKCTPGSSCKNNPPSISTKVKRMLDDTTEYWFEDEVVEEKRDAAPQIIKGAAQFLRRHAEHSVHGRKF